MLADSGIGEHEWSQDMRHYLRREEELVDAGDVDAAIEFNLERWALSHVRDMLRSMQRRALELDAASEGGELVWPDARPLTNLTMPSKLRLRCPGRRHRCIVRRELGARTWTWLNSL